MEADAPAIKACQPRVRYPEDEDGEIWLPMLLDAYAVLDAGLALAVAASGRRLACGSGCFACCRQPIPASSLEVRGLIWYALRQCRGRIRHLLHQRLLARPDREVCPFLVGGNCAAYVMRPLACREFLMFGAACRPGEHPDQSRPGDLLPLPKAAQTQAFWLMLPYYGLTELQARRTGLRDHLILRNTGLLQECDWSSLARAMG
jgi:uncharacterized protein